MQSNGALQAAHNAGDKEVFYNAVDNFSSALAQSGNYKAAFGFKAWVLDERKKLSRLEAEKQNTYVAQVALFSLLPVLIAFVFVVFVLYRKRRELVFKHREAELRQTAAEVEMKALRSQMNPHFIFNSMNSIYKFMRLPSVVIPYTGFIHKATSAGWILISIAKPLHLAFRTLAMKLKSGNLKKSLITLLAFVIHLQAYAQTVTFHDFSAVTITGDTISMSQYAGQKVMVANVATFCGFTNQYADLVTLDSLYGSAYNFVILGFPCNDFGAQEPFDDSTIAAFAASSFNVKFQMMHKISIAAVDTLELYKWLQLQNRNGVANAPVTWNFNKFLINEQGQWIAHHSQTTSPLDTAIVNWITSSPTSVTTQNKNAEIKLLQNPVSQNIQLQISNITTSKVTVQLLDVYGKLIADVFNQTISGTALITYPAKDLRVGNYFFK